MKYHQHTGGYSFVEVLVSIAILLVAIVGPITIASSGIKNATFAREQNIAFFLAQEALEEIVYLRETAALGEMQSGGTNTWGWTSSIPAACRNGSRPCKVDTATHTISECNPSSECALSYFESGTIRYRHASGGAATPYTRSLYFELAGDSLQVRSIVSWNSNAFASTRSVELDTYLYDIYGN